MTKIGIVGSRRRHNDKAFNACRAMFFSIYSKGDTIVSGGCPLGGDKFAEIIAKENKIPISIHPAKWEKYGKAAGFQRNTLIAQESDIVIAVVAKDRKGGTEDTINKTLKMGKEVLIVDPIEGEDDPEYMMV